MSAAGRELNSSACVPGKATPEATIEAATSATPFPAPPDHQWISVKQQFASQVRDAGVPAAALIIVDKGKVPVLCGFGKATPDTPFRLGSITKTFTALALLHAAAAAELPLSTEAQALLGDDQWTNRFRKHHPVTLAQLLELSAGFGDISGAEFASAVPLPRLTALQQHRSSHKTHWPPGLQHSYSNLPPAFSALAVEALGDIPFAQYLAQRVLQPLGMPSASIAPVPDLPGGFKADGLTPIIYWHTIYPAFGGLNATPREFSNFLLHMSEGALPTELQRAAQHRGNIPLYQPITTAAARNGLRLGYGAGIYGSLRNGHLIAGHGGDADGYRSRYGIVSDARRGYFLVINTDNPGLLRRLQRLIEQALVADLPPPAEATPQPTTPTAFQPDAIAPFAGHYYQASARFNQPGWKSCQGNRAVLELTDNGIKLRRGRRTNVLLSAGKRLFRSEDSTIPSVVLLEFADRRYLQGELGNWVQVPQRTSCPDFYRTSSVSKAPAQALAIPNGLEE